MSQPEEPLQSTSVELGETLRRLEARLTRIEAYLQLGPLPTAQETQGLPQQTETVVAGGEQSNDAKQEAWELKIGEFWLARVGIVALMAGAAFFIAYPIAALPPLLHSAIGYLAVAGLIFAGRFWRETYPYLSRVLFGGGLILLYYATLRLHFFSDQQLLLSKSVALVLLLAVVGAHYVLAARRRSEFLAGIAMFLGYATALLGDAAHMTLPMIAVNALVSMHFLMNYGFKSAGLLSVLLAYLSHLLWLLGNPLLNHQLQTVAAPQGNLIYLFIDAAVFALPNLLRREDAHADSTKILLPLLNGGAFLGMAFLVTAIFFAAERAPLNFAVAAFFLLLAATGWIAHQSRFATSFHACFGYMALSAGILARFDAPHYFIWLGWQSLLVISTAIWFRSQIVVVANTIIYLGIFLACLISSPSNAAVNSSYAIVALLSARLLNWKTERLALKTELMRNAYLASAFVIIPYGLYHTVAGNYVSLSWLGAALFYFMMSVVLKNKKYRWMGILTIFLAVIHVFVIDLARLEAGYRIVTFLALGLVLIGVSLLYARYHQKAASQKR